MLYLKKRKSEVSSLNFKNKKGQLIELIIGSVFLLIFAVTALVMYSASDELNNAVQNDNTLDADTKNMSNSLNTAYPNVFDGLIGLLFAGVWLLVIISAVYSNTNPFFLIIGIVVLVGVGFVGMISNNVWNDLILNAEFSSLAVDFPITNFLINQYLLLVLIMGFSGLVVAYRSGSAEL